MRICLIAADSTSWEAPGGGEDVLGRLLATRHEVRVLGGEPDPGLGELAFAGEEHRRAAAAMTALRRAYPERGPDYVEVADTDARGLVVLQARLSGDPLLRETAVGVRAGPARGLIAGRDRALHAAGNLRVAELEHEQLRLADALIWPGGHVLDLYREHYGAAALPPAFRVPPALERPPDFGLAAATDPAAPLRILYAGPIGRAAGALDLAEACLGLPFEGWELTIAGADTATAPMGQSARGAIEAMAGGDPRLRIEDGLALEELRRRLPDHDLFAAPSPIGCGAFAAREALRAGVPVLAAATGELADLVVEGVSGWLAGDGGAAALRRALSGPAGDRDELARARRSGAVGERFAALADPERTLDGYERLLETVSRSRPAVAAIPARPPAPAGGPLVTGIVPYHGAAAHVGEAVGSLLRQTHRELEVVIVNDGSFEPEDAVLDRLAADPRVSVVTQPNAGESAARALGVRLAAGEYVVMLDADNALEPGFVARALSAFRREPELAYVTCWLRYVGPDGSPPPGDPGYAPLGNAVWSGDDHNWDGDTLAMLPRRLLLGRDDLLDRENAIQSDWELYRMLRAEGRFGAVIPERLGRYRRLDDSISRRHDAALRERAWLESRARIDARRARLSREGRS